MEVDLFKRKKLATLSSLFFGTVLSINIVLLTMTTSSFKNITNFIDGINVCYGRVNQTHTSSILGLSQNEYLSKEFVSDSENCMSDLSGLYEQKLSSLIPTIKVSMNELIDQVHQYNDALNIKKSPFSSTSGQSFSSSRFSKIESAKFNIDREIDREKKNLNSKSELLNYILYFSLFLTFGSLMYAFRGSIRKYQRSYELEKDIFENLSLGPYQDEEKAKRLILESLDLNNFTYTSRLFDSIFQDKVSIQSDSRNKNATNTNAFLKDESDKDSIAFVTKKSPTDSVLDRVWAESEARYQISSQEVVKSRDVSSLEEILMRNIDSLSSKFLTQGITVEFNIDDQGLISKELEELCEQLIYNFIEYSIEDNLSGKSIIISISKDDDLIFCIKEYYNNSINSVTESDSINLSICREIISDLGGQIQIDFLKDTENKIIGKKSTFNLVFENITSTSEEKRLISLQKGSRRDIEKKIKSSTLEKRV